MSRQPIINEALRLSRPKIDQNFTELYDGSPLGEIASAQDKYRWTYDAQSGGWIASPVKWDEIEGKPETYPPTSHEHSHFTRTDNPHNTTREQVAAAPVYSQTINMMADSGRFGGKQNPLSLYTPDAFVPSSFFGSYNGSTVSAGGKFVLNNTTNGGTRGALAEDVTSLLAAMGRSGNNARYGVEFFVCNITAGSGTAAPQTAGGYTGYLLTSNGAKAVFGFGNYATMIFWVRIKSGEALIIPNRGALRRNEQSVSSSVVLTPASGWTHINTQTSTLMGYDGPFPNLSAKADDVVQIACPAVFAGQAYPGVHAAPLPAMNGMETV